MVEVARLVGIEKRNYKGQDGHIAVCTCCIWKGV